MPKLKYQQLLFLSILAVAFFLRFYSLSTNGLWIDEIWSMNASSSEHSYSEIIQICSNDTHPPLFDLLLHYFILLTNGAEFSGRYLALFFGMLSIVISYYYAKKISKKTDTALLAMGIVALNYFHVVYSFEGRFYTFIYLLSTISIAELYLYTDRKKGKHLILFGISSLLLVYTHYYGAILLCVLSILMLILLLFKQLSKKEFTAYCVTAAIITISFLPWVPFMLAKNGGDSWMQAPSIGDFFNYYYLYTGKNPLEFVLLFVPLLLFLKFNKDNKKLAVFLYGSILLGFLIPYIVSQFNTPMLHKRYTFIYLPSIYLMAALFWSSIPYKKEKLKRILLGILTLGTLGNLVFLKKDFKADYKDQWKEVSLFLKQSNNTLPVYAEQNSYLNFYLNLYGMPEAKHTDKISSSAPSTYWVLRTNYDETNSIEQLNLTVIETKDYPKKFHLYKVSRHE